MEVIRAVGLILFCSGTSFAFTSDTGGFLFTAPKRFLSGYDENVCITFRNQSEPVKVRVAILEQKEDIEIASALEKITDTDKDWKCFKISIPRTKTRKGRLQLTIRLTRTEEDFNINYIEQISIQTNPDITFIQTDKPVYNGGNIVRFRIFTVRPDLTPVLTPVEKIWIENPYGTHLTQWLNESTHNGFINKTFQLSSEPLHGKWVIRMKRKDSEVVSQSFLVENHILPKFYVTIRAPEHINLSSGNITICAKYIFGEPVHGDVILQYYIKCSFFYYCQENASLVSQNLRLESDGCVGHRFIWKSANKFAQSLIVNATVLEAGTRTKAKTSAKIEIRNSGKVILPVFSSDTKAKKFKPGLPFKGQVVLEGQEEVNETVLVCLEVNDHRSCKEWSMQTNSTEFIVSPFPVTDKNHFKAFLEVKSLRENLPETNQIVKLNLVPWYSPSGSYLLVEDLSKGSLQCGGKAKFNIIYSQPDSSAVHFHYMVKARGDILTKGVLDEFSILAKPYEVPADVNVINHGNFRQVLQFEISIDVSIKMSPRSYLLVYFIRDDGEVVADTLHLNVERCLPNKVETKWSKHQSLPGTGNSLRIATSSNSICALTVTGKSIKLISNLADFREEKVFKQIENFDMKTYTSVYSGVHCRDDSDDKRKLPADEIEVILEPRGMDSRFVDSLHAFNDFGVLVITDLILETRPCKEKGDDKSVKDTTARNSKVNVYGTEIENISMFKAEEILNSHQTNFKESSIADELRTFFPETWIWDLVHIDESGTANLNLEVPHTLTEWTAETTCLSLTNGLGISKPSKLITYKPFFLDFTIPHSLKKKEIFHLHVSVFNYEKTDLPVKVTLIPNVSFISKSEESRSYCIRSKSKVVHKFILEWVKLGETEIMVKAEIDPNPVENCETNVIFGRGDIVVKRTTIKHEGYPMEDISSGFICANSSHFDHQVTWNIKIPPDAIESSVALEALVSGDILGPTLKNIDHLIALPTGCGEQNMILLVPNVLLLDYLLLTKPEELEPIERALKNLDLGYQRQLNYKHSDGSYSAFGEEDERGSIWLTAFVVRYLSQAKKYIYVDENDLNVSLSWIMKQQLENGCFPRIGKIYHRKLQDKLLEEDSSKSLTAYILISLIEAGISVKNPVVSNAIYCLKPTEESLGIYGDLLSSHALILAGEYRDSQALMMKLLKEAKRSYGMLWWETDDSIESSIELTGYGILSLVKLGGPYFLAAASEAVRWLIQHLNYNGGFVSSQDTVLALEAISKFSAKLPKTNEHDKLSINLNTIDRNYIFNISKSNQLVQQKVSLPSFLTNVRFQSDGKGCALVQTSLKYNIRRGKPNDSLKVQLRIQSASESNRYSVAKFHICIRYKSPKEKINMAVLEVFMVSGYFPDRSSLYEIRTSRKGVRRWEEYEDKVNFYFEDLKNKKVCVNFLVFQEVCVKNAEPALIKLYDYYNTQHQTTVKYNLMAECQKSSWLDTPFNAVKQESKRELRSKETTDVPPYQGNYFKNDKYFEGFVDFDHDLETPQGGGEVFPVYALPPTQDIQGQSCAHCLQSVPNIFSKLYCSSQIAVKIQILSRETFVFLLDVSPRTNFTSLKRTVSYTMKKECDCPILNSVNGYALMLVTPPRSFKIHHLQELHMDDSVQLYPWENLNEMPNYLLDAIDYCQRWSLGNY